jgi:putative lipoprotein
VAAARDRCARLAAPEAPLSRLGRGAAIALLLAAATAKADDDPWFGADKGIHFGASAGLAIAGYGAAATFAESRPVRIAYGASVALLAGIGKELWDTRAGGSGSFKDLTYDVLGTAVGLAICWAIDELFFRPAAEPARAVP